MLLQFFLNTLAVYLRKIGSKGDCYILISSDAVVGDQHTFRESSRSQKLSNLQQTMFVPPGVLQTS